MIHEFLVFLFQLFDAVQEILLRFLRVLPCHVHAPWRIGDQEIPSVGVIIDRLVRHFVGAFIVSHDVRKNRSAFSLRLATCCRVSAFTL
jgi:hypothetical protein